MSIASSTPLMAAEAAGFQFEKELDAIRVRHPDSPRFWLCVDASDREPVQISDLLPGDRDLRETALALRAAMGMAGVPKPKAITIRSVSRRDLAPSPEVLGDLRRLMGLLARETRTFVSRFETETRIGHTDVQVEFIS